LILDEVLNAVEPRLENRTWARILREITGKVLIIVSYRQDVLGSADAIIDLTSDSVTVRVALHRERQPA
jgi:ABC-type bacteriocin/lantibiotic exporter with double-glycine peptidase domain